MEDLRRNIQISDYQGETFPFDPSKVKALANVYKPEGLLDRLDPDDDFTTAVELYKAYDTVTPLLASLPDLWVYLAHVDLFPYVQQRHSDVLKDDVTEKYIVSHWFENDVSVFRMALPSAWWSVYLSVDNERENPFELTEILFKNQELRTNSFWSFIFDKASGGYERYSGISGRASLSLGRWYEYASSIHTQTVQLYRRNKATGVYG